MADVQDAPTIAAPACRCGSTDHRRINHSSCPLNPKNSHAHDQTALEPNASPKSTKRQKTGGKKKKQQVPEQEEEKEEVVVVDKSYKDGQAVVIVNLPDETHLHILLYLKPLDALRLGQTSRMFANLVQTSSHWSTLLESYDLKVHEEGAPRVTFGKAKTLYRLSDADLAQIPFKSCRNPYYRSAAPMKLYDRERVQLLCLAKFGGPRGVAEKHAKCEIAAAKRKVTMSGKKLTRAEELEDALKARGLKLRDDSSLCHAFIHGGGDHPLPIHDVVERMMDMHLIHEHSVYEELSSDAHAECLDDPAGFWRMWESAKADCEDTAKRLLRHAEKEYDALPQEKKTAKICACGRPRLRKRMVMGKAWLNILPNSD
ncbi:hypothetical protein HKX48_004159 [Thoreauomyces humboldtii]|nr:hypothetical protein HKX48_004159 [Thoreauomyces humboldtii]